MAVDVGLARRALVASPPDDADAPGVVLRCRVPDLRARLRGERQVFCRAGLPALACMAFMVYGAGLVLRNIAFYRYRGLDYYADLVVPQSAAVSAEGVGIVDVSTGRTVPLREALRAEWSSRARLNVSVSELPAASNLTALHGEAFNLRDVAAENLWDLSASTSALLANEVIAQTFEYSLTAFCFLPFFLEFRGFARPLTVSMWYRLQRSLATVHLLRVPTYLVTSIPGAAIHCQSSRWTGPDGEHGSVEVGQAHVQTLRQWLFDTYNLRHNSNCGDLFFSGHVATSLTNALFLHYYARKMLPRGFRHVAIALAWSACCLQIFFVVCTRNHYTVDVVVAMYVAPLSFLANVYFFPTDPSPEEEFECDSALVSDQA